MPPSPLHDLTSDLHRRWRWLPDPPGGRWTRVWGLVEHDRPRRVLMLEAGVRWLPMLLVPERPAEQRYGRPPSELTRPDQVEHVAWLRDCVGLTINDIARRLSPNVEDEAETAHQRRRRKDRRRPYTAATKAQVVRDIAAGRRRFAERGVLPWTAFPAGVLPAEWWCHPAFEDSITSWKRQAILDPSPPRPPEEMLRREAALVVSRQMTALRTQLTQAPQIVMALNQRVARVVQAAGVEPWRFNLAVAGDQHSSSSGPQSSD